jgi:hypothetical protein
MRSKLKHMLPEIQHKNHEQQLISVFAQLDEWFDFRDEINERRHALILNELLAQLTFILLLEVDNDGETGLLRNQIAPEHLIKRIPLGNIFFYQPDHAREKLRGKLLELLIRVEDNHDCRDELCFRFSTELTLTLNEISQLIVMLFQNALNQLREVDLMERSS